MKALQYRLGSQLELSAQLLCEEFSPLALPFRELNSLCLDSPCVQSEIIELHTTMTCYRLVPVQQTMLSEIHERVIQAKLLVS